MRVAGEDDVTAVRRDARLGDVPLGDSNPVLAGGLHRLGRLVDLVDDAAVLAGVRRLGGGGEGEQGGGGDEQCSDHAAIIATRQRLAKAT